MGTSCRVRRPAADVPSQYFLCWLRRVSSIYDQQKLPQFLLNKDVNAQEVCGGKRRHPSKMYTRIGLEDDKKESLVVDLLGVFLGAVICLWRTVIIGDEGSRGNWVAPMN